MEDEPVSAGRPAPLRSPLNLRMWESISRRSLELQTCVKCGHVRFPPSPVCPECLSSQFEWVPVRGTGCVISWVTFHKQYFDAFPVPYSVVAAELPEGPIVTALTDIPVEDLNFGVSVRLTYVEALFMSGETRPIYQWSLQRPDGSPLT